MLICFAPDSMLDHSLQHVLFVSQIDTCHMKYVWLGQLHNQKFGEPRPCAEPWASWSSCEHTLAHMKL